MVLAQKMHEAHHPVVSRPRARRRTSPLQRLINNRIVCVLLLAAVVCFAATAYVGAYARVTEKGYQRARLLAQLKTLRLENEDLRLRVEALRDPGQIAEFAIKNGMVQSQEMAYLSPTTQPRVAQNMERSDYR
jgi:cell division protein FtsB